MITFAKSYATAQEIIDEVVKVIGSGRKVTIRYNGEHGILYEVDVPDATAAEEQAIQTALVAAFPRETCWKPLISAAIAFHLPAVDAAISAKEAAAPTVI